MLRQYLILDSSFDLFELSYLGSLRVFVFVLKILSSRPIAHIALNLILQIKGWCPSFIFVQVFQLNCFYSGHILLKQHR